MSLAYIIFVLVVMTRLSESAKILALFPMPSISHQVVFRHVTQELARRGHEVTVITADPAFPKGETPGNLTEIDVHDISYKFWGDAMGEFGIDDIILQMKVILKFFWQLFELQMKDETVSSIVMNKKNKFDLVLMEACFRPAVVLSHIFDTPLIQLSSFGAMIGGEFVTGAPYHPLLYPMTVHKKIYNLSLWEKISELIFEVRVQYLYYNMQADEDKMLQSVFGPNVPSMSELFNNIDMMFYNVYPIWADNQPMPPNIVYMGGIHQKPQKKLPTDLQTYLDSSRNGVIYVSFGTNVPTSRLPKEKLQFMLKVFSQLPYNVLLKWDQEELPGRPKNVKISKYFPQSDVLRHPNIKLFITQGGLQSTDEAITAGVPLIGIPMLADQWYNVEKYVHHKIGLRLDMEAITEDNFRNSIETVIGDKSYRENIVRFRTIVYDTPQRPLERVIWWTEHVLRHKGAKHLRSPAANISWMKYFEIELVLTVLAAALLCLSVIIFAVYYVYIVVFKNNVLIVKYKKG